MNWLDKHETTIREDLRNRIDPDLLFQSLEARARAEKVELDYQTTITQIMAWQKEELTQRAISTLEGILEEMIMRRYEYEERGEDEEAATLESEELDVSWALQILEEVFA